LRKNLKVLVKNGDKTDKLLNVLRSRVSAIRSGLKILLMKLNVRLMSKLRRTLIGRL